jgi:signal transduction histidine kinase
MALGVPFLLCWPMPWFVRDVGVAPYWANVAIGDGFNLFGLWIGAVFAVGIWHLHHKARLLRGIALVLDIPAEPLPVIADPARLWQAISNLLTNAGKFTDDGGMVRVRGSRDGAYVAVSVTDTGCGIAAGDLPSVFARFRLARPTTPRSGLGIGLALVKAIAEHHGGHVTAASPGLGRGSTFTICLPLADGAVPRVPTSSVAP